MCSVDIVCEIELLRYGQVVIAKYSFIVLYLFYSLRDETGRSHMRKIGILPVFILCLLVVGIAFLNSEDETSEWVCSNDEIVYTFDTLLSYFNLQEYTMEIDINSEHEPLIEPTSIYQIDTDTEDCGIGIFYEDSSTNQEMIEIVIYNSMYTLQPDTPDINCGSYSDYRDIEADFKSNCVRIISIEDQELVLRVSTQYSVSETTAISQNIEILKANYPNPS